MSKIKRQAENSQEINVHRYGRGHTLIKLMNKYAQCKD